MSRPYKLWATIEASSGYQMGVTDQGWPVMISPLAAGHYEGNAAHHHHTDSLGIASLHIFGVQVDSGYKLGLRAEVSAISKIDLSIYDGSSFSVGTSLASTQQNRLLISEPTRGVVMFNPTIETTGDLLNNTRIWGFATNKGGGSVSGQEGNSDWWVIGADRPALITLMGIDAAAGEYGFHMDWLIMTQSGNTGN
jgi:hypothetical protein